MSAPSLLIGSALLVGLSLANAPGAELGSVADHKRSEISLLLGGGEGWQQMSVTWGTKDEATGKSGPRLRLTTIDEQTDAGTVELDARARDELFREAQRLAASYRQPASFLEDPADEEYLTLGLGSPVDPVLLTFQKGHPAQWNQAVGLWEAMREHLDAGAAGEAPELAPVELPDGSAKPAVGVGPISDYLKLDVSMTLYTDKGENYEVLNFGWHRRGAGNIEFQASWYPRIGDADTTEPDPEQIKPLFDKLSASISKYRIAPSSVYAMKSDAVTRDYNALTVSISNGGPGEVQWVFFERDTRQWAAAVGLWGASVALFDRETQERIAKP